MMNNTNATTSLIFKGSGPGDEFGFNVQNYNLVTRSQSSHKPPHSNLFFFRRINNHQLIAVKGFGDQRQEIVLLNTQNDSIEVLAWIENAALMFPALSPDMGSIAVLILPGRRDAPPRNSAIAHLCHFPLNFSGSDLSKRRITITETVAQNLPAIPIDWDTSEKGIFYTGINKTPHIYYYDLINRKSHQVRTGLFPRLNADKTLLALIDDRNILVVNPQCPEKILASTTLNGHPGYLTWHPESTLLAFSEELPMWRMKIGIIDVKEAAVKTIMETARIKDLVWIDSYITWPKY